MRILITFARTYPLQSAIMLFALVLAGIAEGFGLTALLPLLGLAFSSRSQSTPDQWTGLAGNESGVGQTVTEGLKFVGLEPSAGILLMVLVGAIILKSALVLLAKKRVGYTVAQVATELRLTLLRELLVARWEYFLRQPVGSLGRRRLPRRCLNDGQPDSSTGLCDHCDAGVLEGDAGLSGGRFNYNRFVRPSGP